MAGSCGTGEAAAPVMMEWWFSPLSGAVSHEIAPWAYWHARCMVLAWGVLLPLGAIVARFYKVLPGQNWPRELDNARWWHGHRRLQWAGVGVMTLGLWLAWNHAAEQGGGIRAHNPLGESEWRNAQ